MTYCDGSSDAEANVPLDLVRPLQRRKRTAVVAPPAPPPPTKKRVARVFLVSCVLPEAVGSTPAAGATS